METKLRLIEGSGAPQQFGLTCEGESLAACGVETTLGRPLLKRPGDHLETLWLNSRQSVLDIRNAARERRIHPDTAVAIVLERRLAIQVLGERSATHLNGLSALQTPEVELWSAHSDYLRHLLHGSGASDSFAASDSQCITVPIRLIDRLASDLPEPMEPIEDELSLSISWEIAALLCSETLSEWSYRTALEGCSFADPPTG